jgi:hypothetical protein
MTFTAALCLAFPQGINGTHEPKKLSVNHQVETAKTRPGIMKLVLEINAPTNVATRRTAAPANANSV